MDGTTTIRRSPRVLIRTFIIIEFLGFVGYFLLATLGYYKYELYTHLPIFSSLISYQVAKFLFLSGAQLIITIYAFFHWYYETYVIQPEAITHKWGVFFKKEKGVIPRETLSVTLSVGPLGKFLHYGTVTIGNGGKENSLALSDVSYPKKHYEEIRQDHETPSPLLRQET